MEVACSEGSWTEPSSRRVFSYRLWKPTIPRALLILVHGFGEHSGRYQRFAQALAEQGICVAAPDLWGHGRSGGRRGDIIDVTQGVNDTLKLTTEVFLPASSQTQYALFGHSFGALVAISWALDHPPNLQCVVIQSPLLEVGFPIPAWKRIAAVLLARYWPTYSLSMNLDVGALSHDPSVADAYRADPFVHNAMSVRTYRSVLRTKDLVFAHAGALRVPVLLLCGAEDRIISVAQAQRWFDQLTCEKRRVMFPGCYHELHHEPIRDEVFQLVREWVLTKG